MGQGQLDAALEGLSSKRQAMGAFNATDGFRWNDRVHRPSLDFLNSPFASRTVKPIDVLAAYLKAYQAKDIDAIAGMLSDDVHLQDWNLEAHGKAVVLAETLKNFRDATHLEIQVRQFYEASGCAAARLRIVVNRSIELEVVDTIEVNPDGKVRSIRAYKG